MPTDPHGLWVTKSDGSITPERLALALRRYTANQPVTLPEHIRKQALYLLSLDDFESARNLIADYLHQTNQTEQETY